MTSVSLVLFLVGFFVAIGHTPNTSVFKDSLDLDESGYILNKERFDIPEDVSKFNSLEIAKKIKQEYIKILEPKATISSKASIHVLIEFLEDLKSLN